MAAKVCPRHRIPLRTDCPACGQKFHPMVARSRPGFCHRCRRWLGSSISKPAFTPSECEADHEIAQTISDFLRSLFPENIDTLVKCLFEEILQALVRYPSQWRVRQALPSFVDMREPAAYDEWKRMLVELELVECSANVEEKSDSFSKS
jgi:hypothetical protein